MLNQGMLIAESGSAKLGYAQSGYAESGYAGSGYVEPGYAEFPRKTNIPTVDTSS